MRYHADRHAALFAMLEKAIRKVGLPGTSVAGYQKDGHPMQVCDHDVGAVALQSSERGPKSPGGVCAFHALLSLKFMISSKSFSSIKKSAASVGENSQRFQDIQLTDSTHVQDAIDVHASLLEPLQERKAVLETAEELLRE
jgi:hypothetical protein